VGEVDLQGLIDVALNRWTLMTAGGVFFLIRVLSQLLSKVGWYRRLLPVLPELLGVGATIAGGNPAVGGRPLVLQVAAGLWCGYLAQRFHKVLGQTILGDDKSIEERPQKKVQPQQEEES
jgi:hypothetical protein